MCPVTDFFSIPNTSWISHLAFIFLVRFAKVERSDAALVQSDMLDELSLKKSTFKRLHLNAKFIRNNLRVIMHLENGKEDSRRFFFLRNLLTK
jgi:hypothetical protein